jgi:formylglycine-generating enzyme required for sulfatase activity
LAISIMAEQATAQPVSSGTSAAPATKAVAGGNSPATQRTKELKLDLGNGVSLKLILIPAGKFLMGSPESEKLAAVKEVVEAGAAADTAKRLFANEVQHEVTISKPFYLGLTHVTVDQFAAFVKDSGYKTDAEKGEGLTLGLEIKDGKLVLMKVDGCTWRNPSFDQKGDHPVIQVSWNDAQAFCAWLSKKSGKTVVLPTEAQWEYACRAGTKTAYPWGDNPDDGKGWANCADQSLKKKLPNESAIWIVNFFGWDDGYVFTSPVGSFKANAFGLYDMIGNARQWCQDRYGDYEKGAVTDPTGDTGGSRVLRGGSWHPYFGHCRSAYRDMSMGTPSSRNDFTGFRVVALAAGVD